MDSSILTRDYIGRQRFIAGHQTPTTGFAGTAGFVATTPVLTLSSATKPLVVARMVLSQIGTIAGADIGFVMAIDSATRYASGGATIASKNTDLTSSKTATAVFKGTEPTAGAAGAGTYYFGERLIEKDVGRTDVIEFPDGMVVPALGTFLVYAWAATTDPTLAITLEWLER